MNIFTQSIKQSRRKEHWRNKRQRTTNKFLFRFVPLFFSLNICKKKKKKQKNTGKKSKQISVSSLRSNAPPPLRFPPFSGRLSFVGDNRGPRLIMSWGEGEGCTVSKRVIDAAYAIVSWCADATGQRGGWHGSSITGISKPTVHPTVLHPFHKTGKTPLSGRRPIY